MSCNCKNDKKSAPVSSDTPKSGLKVINTIVNFITFLLVFSFSIPLIIPIIAYLFFKLIVLKDNTVNMFPLFYKMGKTLAQSVKSDDDTDDGEVDYSDNYEFELEDIELVNVEDK